MAKMDDSAVYLSRTEQLREFLDKGCKIYEVDTDGVHTLIATPTYGFLCNPPKLEKSTIVKLGGQNGENRTISEKI